MARNRCSVETYSSLKLSASLNACSNTSFSARPMCCWANPCTFGNRPMWRSISWDSASLRTPRRARSGGTTPSACDTSAASKCSGSICWFSCCAATSSAACTASCALTVIFSNRNITTSFQATATEKGAGTTAQLPNLALLSSARPALPAGGGRGHRRSRDVDLDLLRLGFLVLQDGQRQHAVLVVRLDGIRIHGVGQWEAAGEGTVRAFHAQVVLFVHFLLELAFSANGQDVVLPADVQILWIDVRQIGLD